MLVLHNGEALKNNEDKLPRVVLKIAPCQEKQKTVELRCSVMFYSYPVDLLTSLLQIKNKKTK